jgi:hypothetical protein
MYRRVGRLGVPAVVYGSAPLLEVKLGLGMTKMGEGRGVGQREAKEMGNYV